VKASRFFRSSATGNAVPRPGSSRRPKSSFFAKMITVSGSVMSILLLGGQSQIGVSEQAITARGDLPSDRQYGWIASLFRILCLLNDRELR
jgi:hypothetical protein